MTEIANSIYSTGQIPEQIVQSIFIYTNKNSPIDSDKFRAISAKSQLSEIVLKIILNRLRNKIEVDIAE